MILATRVIMITSLIIMRSIMTGHLDSVCGREQSS